MSLSGIFPIDKWDFKSESILTDLSLDDLSLLTRHQFDQVYKKGEIIFREGAYPSGIYFINGRSSLEYFTTPIMIAK